MKCVDCATLVPILFQKTRAGTEAFCWISPTQGLQAAWETRGHLFSLVTTACLALPTGKAAMNTTLTAVQLRDTATTMRTTAREAPGEAARR